MADKRLCQVTNFAPVLPDVKPPSLAEVKDFVIVTVSSSPQSVQLQCLNKS